MYKRQIIDDEPLARDLLKAHIAEVPFLTLEKSFKNAVLASEYLLKNKIDLIFLDIQMPLINGIDFLKSLANPPQIIFTTAYRKYAIESYELQVADYLLKPITFKRFFKAVSRLKSSNDDNEENFSIDYLFVQANKKHHKIILNDILYAESLKDYLKIHMKDKRLVIKERISSFIEKLPSNRFIQVHRSFIVSLDKITGFTSKDLEIGDIEIPIGGNFKERTMNILKQSRRK